MNYYKDLWNNPNTEAGQFFNKTDFNHKDYKRQEQVFRYFLKIIKDRSDDISEPIESVLEVGVGTARMMKIVTEELHPPIYDVVDIKLRGPLILMFNNCYEVDIVSDEFDKLLEGKQYDLILASEVLMHIKPDDIDSVLKRLTDLLAPNAVIVNIDWYHQPEPSTWCYIHDYEKMYIENGLYPVFTADIPEIKQKLFCYGK